MTTEDIRCKCKDCNCTEVISKKDFFDSPIHYYCNGCDNIFCMSCLNRYETFLYCFDCLRNRKNLKEAICRKVGKTKRHILCFELIFENDEIISDRDKRKLSEKILEYYETAENSLVDVKIK